MDKTTCSIEDCTNPAEKRGWCPKHYRRWHRHGDPLGGGLRRYRDPEDTFQDRIRPEGNCLIWTGKLNDQGYGRLRVDGILVRAHRYAWDRVNGPIPDGMYVDHACHNRACVEVLHLRLATHAENEANRSGATKRSQTGVRNVTKSGGRFRVNVQSRGRRFQGEYDTLDEAAAAAAQARLALFGKFAGGA